MRLSSSTTFFLFSTIVSTTTSFLHPYTKHTNQFSFIHNHHHHNNDLVSSKSTACFVSTSSTSMGKPGTAELGTPWEDLGFEFRPTKSNLRIVYKDGKWGEMELCEVCTSMCVIFKITCCNEYCVVKSHWI